MVNYDNFNEDQREQFFKAIEDLKDFRKRADFIMYYAGNPLDDANQKEMRKVYDTVCSALDLLP